MSRYAWGLLAGGALVAGALLGFGLALIWKAARERRAAQQQLGKSRPPVAQDTPRERLRCIRCSHAIDWPATEPHPHACVVCKMPAAYTAGNAVRSIFEAGIQRQTERLRAELDDDQAVARWLTGGPR